MCRQMSKEAMQLDGDDLSDEEMSFGSDMDGEFDDVISDQEEAGPASGRSHDHPIACIIHTWMCTID